MGKKHTKWDDLKNHEKKKGCGCIWRHASGWDSSPTDCHYAMNSYNALDGRQSSYNNDNKQRAIDLGYLDPDDKDPTDQAKKDAAKGLNTKKNSKIVNKYLGKHLTGPLHWLRINKNGWNVGYTINSVHLQSKNMVAKGPRPNFLPCKKNETISGYGWWYPYYHEHHHIFSQGAYKEYVIYGTGKDITKRIQITLASGWNINNETNMIMLPSEIIVARIIQLPAHRFWGTPGHKDYSQSIKKDLENVLDKMNEAIKENKPCEETDIKIKLKKILDAKSTKFYTKIIAMNDHLTNL